METVILTRGQSTVDGIFGNITFCGQTLLTLELPWKNNASDISCIPPAPGDPEISYDVIMAHSDHFNKDLYHIQNVLNRSNCMIHQGNYGGDTSQQRKSDIEGCILLGEGTDVWQNEFGVQQKVITSSSVALANFMNALNNEPFTLIIKNA